MKKDFSLLSRIVSLEYWVVTIVVAAVYIWVYRFDWWWLILQFPLIDVSMLGYLINTRAGALVYNVFHSFITPSLLLLLYMFFHQEVLVALCLLLIFHILVDRALGYGLKYSDSFDHTHLGMIGKSKK